MLTLPEAEIRQERGIYAFVSSGVRRGAPPGSSWGQTINGFQVLVTMDYGARLALLGQGPPILVWGIDFRNGLP